MLKNVLVLLFSEKYDTVGKGGIEMEEKVVYHQRGKDPLYKTWHASEEHLFLFCHSEGGSVVTGEKVLPLKKGVLLFIAAQTYHYTMPDFPAEYDRSKLFVSAEYFARLMTLFDNGKKWQAVGERAMIYAEIPPHLWDKVASVFEEGQTALLENEPLFLSGLLLLISFLEKYTVQSTAAPSGWMARAVRYINQNISTDLTVEEICAAMNVSKYHFCRRFKQHTGMTVMQYILKTRIILAKNELRKTVAPVTEISETCGFSSPSYFCRIFRQEAGCSPLQYRKQNT